MYICFCRVVTDHQIVAAVHHGTAPTFETLRSSFGLGHGCGACLSEAERCYEAARSDAQAAQPASRTTS